MSFSSVIKGINWSSCTVGHKSFTHSHNMCKEGSATGFLSPPAALTCMGLSYQRLPPFFAGPPPCSINMARVVSLRSAPEASSRHTKHRQRSIMSRESLFVDSRGQQQMRSGNYASIGLMELGQCMPLISTLRALAHSVRPSEVRRPIEGSRSSSLSAILAILLS